MVVGKTEFGKMCNEGLHLTEEYSFTVHQSHYLIYLLAVNSRHHFEPLTLISKTFLSIEIYQCKLSLSLETSN